MIIENTPIEKYQVQGRTIYVKREDLCVREGGPPFSKCRGAYKHLQNLKTQGVEIVSYVEGPVSMAGWCIAWCAKILGMKAVIFVPKYVGTTPAVLMKHCEIVKNFGAEIIEVPAAKNSILNARSKKILTEKYPDAVLLKTGLPFDTAIEENAQEWKRTEEQIKPKNVILSVGSGMVCSGILHGLTIDCKITGVLCAKKDAKLKESAIWRKSGRLQSGFFGLSTNVLNLVQGGFEYMEIPDIVAPFPCNPFYDLKAWHYLINHLTEFEDDILFWNIGR